MTETAELQQLTSKYIAGVERVLKELCVNVNQAEVLEVVDHAKRYLSDAKFFMGKGDYRTALISIVYSEGLLDALKMLKLAEFSWRFY